MRKRTGKIAGFLSVILMTACLGTGGSLRNIAGTQISSQDAVPDTLDRESLLEPGTQRLSESGAKKLMKWMRQTDRGGGTLYINLRLKTKRMGEIVAYLEQFSGPHIATNPIDFQRKVETERKAQKYVPEAMRIAEQFSDLRKNLHEFFNDSPEDTTDVQLAYEALKTYSEQLKGSEEKKKSCDALAKIHGNFTNDLERYSNPDASTSESTKRVWKGLIPDTSIRASRARINLEDCQNELSSIEENLLQTTQAIFQLYDKINIALQNGLASDTKLTDEMEKLISTVSAEFQTKINDLKLKE